MEVGKKRTREDEELNGISEKRRKINHHHEESQKKKSVKISFYSPTNNVSSIEFVFFGSTFLQDMLFLIKQEFSIGENEKIKFFDLKDNKVVLFSSSIPSNTHLGCRIIPNQNNLIVKTTILENERDNNQEFHYFQINPLEKIEVFLDQIGEKYGVLKCCGKYILPKQKFKDVFVIQRHTIYEFEILKCYSSRISSFPISAIELYSALNIPTLMPIFIRVEGYAFKNNKEYFGRFFMLKIDQSATFLQLKRIIHSIEGIKSSSQEWYYYKKKVEDKEILGKVLRKNGETLKLKIEKNIIDFPKSFMKFDLNSRTEIVRFDKKWNFSSLLHIVSVLEGVSVDDLRLMNDNCGGLSLKKKISIDNFLKTNEMDENSSIMVLRAQRG